MPGNFYCDCWNGCTGLNSVVWPLLGPFETEAEARQHLPAVKALVEKLEPRAHWYSFGTMRVEGEALKTVLRLNSDRELEVNVAAKQSPTRTGEQ